MAIEILTFAGIFIIYFIAAVRKNPDGKKKFLIMCGIWIVVIMGSRWCNSGFGDEVRYNYLYERFTNMPFYDFWPRYKSGKDIGFYFLYWLTAQVFPSNQIPIYLITGICVFSFFRFYYRNSEDPLVSVLLFFAFGMFSFYMAGYRQCCAMCVCLFALEAAKEKKIYKYVLLLLLAFLLHRSSIIFVPVYFIMQFSRSTGGKAKVLLCSVLVLLFAAPLLEWFSGSVSEESYTSFAYSSSVIGFLINIVIMAVPVAFTFFPLCEFDPAKRSNQVRLVYILIIGAIYFCLRNTYWVFERVSYYYTFAVAAAYGNITESLVRNEKTQKFGVIMRVASIILLLALYFTVRVNTEVVFFWSH